MTAAFGRAQSDPTVDPDSKVSNISARTTLPAGNKPSIIGFVVSGKPGSLRKILVRGVGGSLAQFNVANPIKTPKIQIFDATGKPYTFVRIGVEDNWPALFSRLGAFPLVSGEVARVSFDYGSLPAGSYTVHVTDLEGLGGEVLLEVYDAGL